MWGKGLDRGTGDKSLAPGAGNKSIRLKNWEDLRPAVQLEDVQGAEFIHVKLAHASSAPTFVLKNVDDFNLYQSRPLQDTHLDKVEQQTL
jgi:hypothetical protein